MTRKFTALILFLSTIAFAGENSWTEHKTAGLISLPIVGLQVGLGLALKSQEPNPDIGLRQLHMVSALSLLGLGVYELNSAIGRAPTKPISPLHRWFSYSHLALILITGTVGIIRARTFDRADERAGTWGEVHFGLGLATAATLLGAAFTVPLE